MNTLSQNLLLLLEPGGPRLTLVQRGLVRAAADALASQPSQEDRPAVEAVAWEFQHEETGRMTTLSNDGINNPENFVKNNPWYSYVGELHRHPSKPDAQRKYDALVAEIEGLAKAWRTSQPAEMQPTQWGQGYTKAERRCADELTALIAKHKGAA